jgi:AcrR family transcriptional regulator
VSKGTPYLCFQSKQALFIALHDEWDCGLAERVDAAVQALATLERRSPGGCCRPWRRWWARTSSHIPDLRVLMEARTLAAYHPAIAAAVRAATAAPTSGSRPDPGGCRGRPMAGRHRSGAAGRLFTAALYGLMAHWHLAPDLFSWDAAATALTGDPARPHSGGTRPGRDRQPRRSRSRPSPPATPPGPPANPCSSSR